MLNISITHIIMIKNGLYSVPQSIPDKSLQDEIKELKATISTISKERDIYLSRYLDYSQKFNSLQIQTVVKNNEKLKLK